MARTITSPIPLTGRDGLTMNFDDEMHFREAQETLMEEADTLSEFPNRATAITRAGSLHRLRRNNTTGSVRNAAGSQRRKASLTPSMRQLQTYLSREVSAAAKGAVRLAKGAVRLAIVVRL